MDKKCWIAAIIYSVFIFLCLFLGTGNLISSAFTVAFLLFFGLMIMIGLRIAITIGGFIASLLYSVLGREDLCKEIDESFAHLNGIFLIVLAMLLVALPYNMIKNLL